MKLNDVKAVITGGVSGLGLAVAEGFVAGGGKVALLDVNEDKAADAVEKLGGRTRRGFFGLMLPVKPMWPTYLTRPASGWVA